MTTEERQEVKEMLHDILAGHSAKIESTYSIIDVKLNNIQEQTSKTNGRVTKLEDAVKTLQINDNNHIINCPQAPKLQKLQQDVDSVKNVKNFLIGSVAFIGVVVGIIYSIIKIIS